MAFIRRSIDIISPSDGRHYTSITQYEKSLDIKGQHILSDREYRDMKDRTLDQAHSAPQKKEDFNHVHIDFNNGRIEKSKKDLNV